MRLVTLFLTGLVSYSQVLAAPSESGKRSLDSFIERERAIALLGALNNIGPHGSLVPGAGAGFVIASPSTVNPNYFYTWSRDSALTLKMLIDEFLLGNTSLQPIIEEYIHAQAVLQTVSNPSGTLLPEGLGLGEPKFLADGSQFNGAWGRPQRDGPALRAVALMTYSNYLIQHGRSAEAKTVIWPIISNDLSYVGQYWNQTGFDLWEETEGSSFFTIQNQHRALVEGTTLAKTLGVTCTGCNQAPEILCFLQNFWNGEYVVSNINVDIARTGLDGNSILGSIATFDIDAPCDSVTFQPCNSKSLANFKAVVDSFRTIYAINAGIPKNEGVAIGRYAEDVYFGGNPWYLITSAAAEFLYDAVAQWKSNKALTIDSTSLPFFQAIYPSAKAEKYIPSNGFNTNSGEFTKITDAVTTYADSFVSIVEKYLPSNGSISEQFNRNTSLPLSAYDLTWSFAAFVTMSQRRAGQYPASWGAKSSVQSAQCAGTSTPGAYAPAIAAGAPNLTTTCQVEVTFNVNATTYYGENVYVVGNTSDLGAWNINNALPLGAGGYPIWSASSYLNAGETVSYVFVREEDCSQPNIYETVNRTLTVPACGGATVTVNDTWTGPLGVSGDC